MSVTPVRLTTENAEQGRTAIGAIPGGEARAHGKVILLGEHAVVYGHPALAGALKDGVTVKSVPGSGCLRVPAWGVELDPRDPQPASSLGRAYRALRTNLGIGEKSPVDLSVHFAVPTGAGLGSSGAMAVAVARALVTAHGLGAADACDDSLLSAAMASETVIHGKPSGLDHTVALRGGFGLFTRERGLETVKAAEPVVLVVGHTGKERDTKGRVQRIAELVAQRSTEVNAHFSAIAKLVTLGRSAVERGAHGDLGAAMNQNQQHLETLEVSCPEIERMCTLALDAGAVGAKLTGGGGGGCVIAIAPGREPAIVKVWERCGFRSFVTSVGGRAS